MPRSLQEILDQADALADRFEDDFEPDVTPQVAALRAAVLRRSQAEVDVADAARLAVRSGATWTTIGAAVGTTAQSARERYRNHVAAHPTPPS